MIKAISSFPIAFSMLVKNKVNMLLGAIPVLIGIVLYWFLGKTLFTNALDWGNKYIEQYLSTSDTLGSIVYYLVASILTILLYFLVSWTFVLLVSVIASPFNDILSARIEKILLNEKLPAFNESISGAVTKLFPTLFNEVKKVSFIVSLSAFALLFGYIPILTPISVFISVVLLSIEFLDFSWSRHSMELKECRTDIRKNVFGYSLGGAFFLIIVAIPLVNLIVPSLATSYFTVLWVKSNEHRH